VVRIGVRGKVLVIELGEQVSYSGRLAEEKIPWLQQNWRLVGDPRAWADGRGGLTRALGSDGMSADHFDKKLKVRGR